MSVQGFHSKKIRKRFRPSLPRLQCSVSCCCTEEEFKKKTLSTQPRGGLTFLPFFLNKRFDEKTNVGVLLTKLVNAI
jgi:hypothetical protein